MLNASEIYSVNSTEQSVKTQVFAVLEMLEYVNFFIFSVALPIGLIGNVLSLVVFGASHLKKTSTGHYLMALAVADTIYLSGRYMVWFSDFMENIVMVHGYVHQIDSACKIVISLNNCGRLFSAWLTVVITIERFIAVAYPLQVSIVSTPTRAKVLILILGITCFGMGSFPLYTLNSKVLADGMKWCVQKRDRHVLHNFMILISLTFGEMVIPSGLVCLFTLLILWKLFKSRQMRRKALSSSVGNNTHGHQEAQLTATLLAIAITFCIFRLPFIIFNNSNGPTRTDYAQVVVYYSAQRISGLFFVLNYCINFVYYSLLGTAFRREFLQLFCCKKTKIDRRFVI